MIAGEKRVGPQAHAPHLPHGILFAHAFADAAVDDAVIKLFERQFEMARRIWAALVLQPHAPVHVHPLEMQRVHGVFLALQPVARNIGKDNLHESVFPRERLPIRHERRGLRTQVRPDQTSAFFHGVRGDADFLAELRFRLRDVLVGLFQAAAVAIKQPAVIVAAEPALLDESIGHVGAAMRAMSAHEAERAAHVLVQSEVFTHEANGLDGLGVEFTDSRDGHPIAAEQIAHRRAGSDAGQELVLGMVEHRTRGDSNPTARAHPSGSLA